jgi:hypothetical protein
VLLQGRLKLGHKLALCMKIWTVKNEWIKSWAMASEKRRLHGLAGSGKRIFIGDNHNWNISKILAEHGGNFMQDIFAN